MIQTQTSRDPRAEASPSGRAGRGQDIIGAQISMREVTKKYGAFVAADRISLDVEPGEFITLLGPSGSGKTTLLNLLAGFQRIDGGDILIDGKPITNVPTHRRGFGMVFQSYALFPNMTVAQNVAFPMRMAGLDRATSDRRVAETLEMMRLSEHAAKTPSEMSGGQQQRVAIARAIVMRPRVVLMDEPLSALDRRLRESIQIELRELHQTIGSTILFVTHDQSEALTMSDRIAVLDKGHIIQVDRPLEIYRHPKSRFVAGFVGESNLIEAEVLERRGDTATLRSKAGHVFQAGSRNVPSIGKVTVLIRPERMALHDGPQPGTAPATVTSALFMGETLRIEAAMEGGETLLIRCPDTAARELPAPGSKIHVGWGPQDCWVLA
ncbi:polyamine ABC transporter ATP-binding protein [Frigidibacter albus]|uniref:Spermidine/putrescine import ATP-binding protein PotA n=1 Tax=Frigidibacter albus TaxID=1465486 RepID=A0A6L8VEM4_9RHOB|nr:ABC transporter ATP-binding protein [Frigidibacter albus]MZQ87690.1 polyamine ABC transporter ATP-binding protein [Frigidibacter albus]NBE29596.1 polyamine ABC transporter ATP-binding protein [Frigidibacter albus]GGH43916.1 polyamine-transporting ATPase [Frigidibacter albus]